MYFTACEALEPRDFSVIESVLDSIRQQRAIDIGDPSLEALANDLVNLWRAGIQGYAELRAMLKPLDEHLIQQGGSET